MTPEDSAAIRRIVREETDETRRFLKLTYWVAAIALVLAAIAFLMPIAHAAPTPCYKPGSLQVPCNAQHLTPAEKLKRDRTTLGRVYEGPKPKRVPTTDMRPKQ